MKWVVVVVGFYRVFILLVIVIKKVLDLSKGVMYEVLGGRWILENYVG